jgi:hypothetical protein
MGKPLRNRPLGKPRRMGGMVQVDFREMDCEDGRWMELPQYRVQWRALILAELNLRVLLPESEVIIKFRKKIASII